MPTKLTDALANNPYFWFLKPIWWHLQPPYNKHFAVLACSESGAGKSYDTMSLAEALYPDFEPSKSICFDAHTFAKRADENHKTAFPLILDDAGIAASSGEALTKEVLAISKIAQSIRHKNWQVYINLPNMDLLAKSVRITNHFYLEPNWIDYELDLCYSKFQRMSVNPKGQTKPTFKSPVKYIKTVNEVTGYDEYRKHRFLNLPIPKPSKKVIDEYETMRKEHMSLFRNETSAELEKRHAAKINRRLSGNQMAEIVQGNRELFNVEGKLDPGKIGRKFKISIESARNVMKLVEPQLPPVTTGKALAEPLKALKPIA